MALRYIDIFSGCGGLSLGLQNAGWECLFAIEKNSDAFETYKHNLIKNDSLWPNWLTKTSHDIDEIIKTYRQELINLRGKVDLVAGGPPCQGFSLAGKRNQNDKRNKLVESYIKFIRLVQPKAVMFENVYGFVCDFENNCDKSRSYSAYVVNALRKMGHEVQSEIFDMSYFGVPQKRNRYILVGIMNHSPDYVFNKVKSRKSKFLYDNNLVPRPTVEDAIGDLLKSNGVVNSPDSKRFDAGLYGVAYSDYQMYMRKKTLDKGVADSHRFVNHTDEIIELHQRLLDMNIRNRRITPGDGIIEGLKRRGVVVLNPEGIAPTITSIPDEIMHYREPRILTVREYARLQSFPDHFMFKGKYTSGGKARRQEVPRYTQVANAVPPLFAEQMGRPLMEVLESV